MYACSCELMYCNLLYDVYFYGYDKTPGHHELLWKAVPTLNYFLTIQRTKGNRLIII